MSRPWIYTMRLREEAVQGQGRLSKGASGSVRSRQGVYTGASLAATAPRMKNIRGAVAKNLLQNNVLSIPCAFDDLLCEKASSQPGRTSAAVVHAAPSEDQCASLLRMALYTVGPDIASVVPEPYFFIAVCLFVYIDPSVACVIPLDPT